MLNRLLGKLYGKKAETESPDMGDKPDGTRSGETPVAPAPDGMIQPAAAAPSSRAPSSQEPSPQDVSPAGTAANETEANDDDAGDKVTARAAEAKAAPADGASVDTEALEAAIVEALKTVYDPEIPVNVYELGLIYEVKVEPSGMANVVMTLTAPNCPAAGILPGQIESRARSVDGVYDVKLDLTFDPPWGPERMSDAAKLELGMM